jgi:hypothetical protein
MEVGIDGISVEGRALGKAIQEQRVDELARMLDAGVSPNQAVWPAHHALDFAAKMGQLGMCAKLIERGATVNFQRDFKTGDPRELSPSALHEAAREGYTEIVKLLLAHGANANSVTYRGARPLHFAVGNTFHYTGWVQIAELLLEHGADPNVFMDRWTDPRHWTNERGWAKTHGQIPLFITPLHAAIETSEQFQARQGVRTGPEIRGHECGGARVVRALLEHGADPHIVPEGVHAIYLTPFQQGLKQAPSEDIELMLAHREVDLAQRTVAGKTLPQITLGRPAARALIMSAKTTRLLEQRVDPEAGDSRSVNRSQPQVL